MTAVVIASLPARRRRVTGLPNADGQIELGPLRNAHGLGDTLTVTPCAARLPNAVMLMPDGMAPLAPLFNGLCPVRFTPNYPEFPFIASRAVTDANFACLGVHVEGALPIVKLTPDELFAAKRQLAPYRNPIAICPTCSREWSHVRGRPVEFFAPIVAALLPRYTILQFGYADYPLLPGAVRMPFTSFRHTAALYHAIGQGISLNTGDYHLMLAAGARVLVIEPPHDAMGYNPNMWRYRSPRVRYVDPATPQSVAAALPFFLE